MPQKKPILTVNRYQGFRNWGSRFGVACHIVKQTISTLLKNTLQAESVVPTVTASMSRSLLEQAARLHATPRQSCPAELVWYDYCYYVY